MGNNQSAAGVIRQRLLFRLCFDDKRAHHGEIHLAGDVYVEGDLYVNGQKMEVP